MTAQNLLGARDDIARARHFAQTLMLACAGLDAIEGGALSTTCGALIDALDGAEAKIQARPTERQAA